GVVPDAKEGARYIGLAAEQELTAAQIDYATLLYLGQGVDKDVEAAATWYQRAAEGGNPVAQNRLAKLMAVGEGTTLDLETAAMWRALARRQGLTDPSLDRLLVSIPPEALARAEERARFWPESPPRAQAASASPPPAEVIGPLSPAPTDPQNAPSQVVNPAPEEAAPAADESPESSAEDPADEAPEAETTPAE